MTDLQNLEVMLGEDVRAWASDWTQSDRALGLENRAAGLQGFEQGGNR